MDDNSEMSDKDEQFKALFNQFKRPIHDYIRTITGSSDIAEEMTQDVFVRLWRKKGSFNEIENMDNYIFRIARNECMRYFKKAAVETQLFRDLQGRMTYECNNISEHMNFKETEALLVKAVASLSPQRQKVYQLSRRQDLRIEEIATEMQLSHNTVRNHLVEALRQIRHYFLKYGSFLLWILVHGL